MNLVATTFADIVRGTASDENDDESDLLPDDAAATRVAWNEPVSLIERSNTPYNRSGGVDRVVRYATLRVKSALTSGLQIQKGDRVRDRNTGLIWVVDVPSNVQNPAFTADTRVDLSRTV
jgi:hypothetical protein